MYNKITNEDKIFLAGHNGLVGSAFLEELQNRKFDKIFKISKKKLGS